MNQIAQSSLSTAELTGGRLLARNTMWNMIGQILPAVAGVAVVPALVHGMGVARFGIFSLAWIVIGYFSLFDLGIGRALTKMIADRLGSNDTASVPHLVWTSLLLMFLLGAVSGTIVVAISPWLVDRALSIPQELKAETLHSFYLLGASIAVITVTSGLRGALEAQQFFRVLTIIRIPMGIFSFVGPLLVLPFSRSLVAVVSALIICRLAGCLALLLVCLKAMPSLRRNFAIKASLAIPAIKFGGWMTVSNLVSPIMVYLDRFFIGVLLSVSLVAYYTAPFDVVTRLTMIPSAVAGVLFPALALSLKENPVRAQLLLRRGIKYVFMSMVPLVFIIVALAPELLQLWLGRPFAENSSGITRWLTVGVLFACVSYVPFALIQGAGRPDITAKLHLLELPVYLLALVLMVKVHGVEGASIAWTGRGVLDAALLFWYANRLLPQTKRYRLQQALVMAVVLVIVCTTSLVGGLAIRGTILVLSLLGFALASWLWGLEPNEKAFLFSILPDTFRSGVRHAMPLTMVVPGQEKDIIR